MTLNESLNRTVNLVSTTVIALAGFAFAPEIAIEDKIAYKLDDVLLLLTGIAAIVWYKTGSNRLSRSLMPLIFTLVGLVWKIMAVAIEIKEKDDVGDDFGGLILFICASILIFSLYKKTTNLLKAMPTKN